MPPRDAFPFPSSDDLTIPVEHGFDITPDNDNDLDFIPRALMVTVAGDIAVVMIGGETIVLPGLTVGVLHPFRVKRVRVTSTTATGIKGFY